MGRELTKPSGLFLVTNPNGIKISRYDRNNNKFCSGFFSRNVHNHTNKR